MHLPTRVAVTIGSFALVLGGSMTAAHAQSVSSDVVGHLYVNDNTAGMNTVAGFDRHADGSLSPIAGSPFAAGGAGTGADVGSQVRSRPRATGALSWSPTPAAARSRYSVYAVTARCSGSMTAPWPRAVVRLSPLP